MTTSTHSAGITLYWRWDDREIDNPALLREQLAEMQSAGVSGVIATLKSSRYEFIDNNVLRTVARASQWAKKRNLSFRYHADPRQISRSAITRTGERMQSLFTAETVGEKGTPVSLNIARVENNHFELRYRLPAPQSTHLIKEGTLCYDPVGLEKAFLFQMENRSIIRDTIRDITPHSHFYTNLMDRYTDVFGDILVPKNENWYAIAFPKYNTNQFDFAGRDSRDMLHQYVEDLFDACTHLDGITWGEGGAGYLVQSGHFPVSLSLYNIFKAEYQYDIRDFLYALVLDVNDQSHIPIRNDYFQMLMDTVSGALREFYQIVHSFFSGIDVSLQHTWHMDTTVYNNMLQGSIDPWKALGKVGSAFVEITEPDILGDDFDVTLANLCIARSMGMLSNTRHGYLRLQEHHCFDEGMDYLTDLLGLMSIRGVSTAPENNSCQDANGSGNRDFHLFDALNKRLNQIYNLTGFTWPTANVILVFPVETIISSHAEKATRISSSFMQLVAGLFKAGIQFDVLGSSLLKDAKLTFRGLHYKDRWYDAVIYPYPEILSETGLILLNQLYKNSFTLIMGGPKPAFTDTGKRISNGFITRFHPDDDDLTPIFNAGIKPLFSAPQKSLSTLIRKGTRNYYLLCPDKQGSIYSGNLVHEKLNIEVPQSSSLRIYEANGTAAKCVFGEDV